jgi:hypothetical protein
MTTAAQVAERSDRKATNLKIFVIPDAALEERGDRRTSHTKHRRHVDCPQPDVPNVPQGSEAGLISAAPARMETLTIASQLFTICSEMSAALLPETLPAARSADWARPLLDRQLAVLGRLAEAGLEIAVALEAQARGGEAVVQGDVAMAYNRVARAVRQTIMLQSRLIEAWQDRATAATGRKAAARASAARIVRDVIEDERENDAERTERLTTEAAERLRDEDFGDLLARPFAEAVADIVRDLGLSPDLLALAEDCFAAEAALTGQAGAAPADEPYRGPVDVRWLDDDEPARRRDSG